MNATISISDSETTPECDFIHARLREHVQKQVGPAERRAYLAIAKVPGLETAEKILGGVRGYSHWHWLYISHFWVDETARGDGLGARLLRKTIDEARSRGCHGIYVDTFSGDAKRFYVAHGFTVFGELAQFPPGHDRTFLSLKL